MVRTLFWSLLRRELFPRLLFFRVPACVCLYVLCACTLYASFFVSCKMINNVRTIFDPAYVADGRSSNYFISNALQSSFYARAAFLEPVLKLIIKGRHLPSAA